MKSDVEIYWDAINSKCSKQRKWDELNPQEQMIVMQSINMMLQVLANN